MMNFSNAMNLSRHKQMKLDDVLELYKKYPNEMAYITSEQKAQDIEKGLKFIVGPDNLRLEVATFDPTIQLETHLPYIRESAKGSMPFLQKVPKNSVMEKFTLLVANNSGMMGSEKVLTVVPGVPGYDYKVVDLDGEPKRLEFYNRASNRKFVNKLLYWTSKRDGGAAGKLFELDIATKKNLEPWVKYANELISTNKPWFGLYTRFSDVMQKSVLSSKQYLVAVCNVTGRLSLKDITTFSEKMCMLLGFKDKFKVKFDLFTPKKLRDQLRSLGDESYNTLANSGLPHPARNVGETAYADLAYLVSKQGLLTHLKSCPLSKDRAYKHTLEYFKKNPWIVTVLLKNKFDYYEVAKVGQKIRFYNVWPSQLHMVYRGLCRFITNSMTNFTETLGSCNAYKFSFFKGGAQVFLEHMFPRAWFDGSEVYPYSRILNYSDDGAISCKDPDTGIISVSTPDGQYFEATVPDLSDAVFNVISYRFARNMSPRALGIFKAYLKVCFDHLMIVHNTTTVKVLGKNASGGLLTSFFNFFFWLSAFASVDVDNTVLRISKLKEIFGRVGINIKPGTDLEYKVNSELMREYYESGKVELNKVYFEPYFLGYRIVGREVSLLHEKGLTAKNVLFPVPDFKSLFARFLNPHIPRPKNESEQIVWEARRAAAVIGYMVTGACFDNGFTRFLGLVYKYYRTKIENVVQGSDFNFELQFPEDVTEELSALCTKFPDELPHWEYFASYYLSDVEAAKEFRKEVLTMRLTTEFVDIGEESLDFTSEFLKSESEEEIEDIDFFEQLRAEAKERWVDHLSSDEEWSELSDSSEEEDEVEIVILRSMTDKLKAVGSDMASLVEAMDFPVFQSWIDEINNVEEENLLEEEERERRKKLRDAMKQARSETREIWKNRKLSKKDRSTLKRVGFWSEEY